MPFIPIVTVITLVALLFNQILFTPLSIKAEFEPLPEDQEDLVLVLADSELMQNRSVNSKVTEYSQDIQLKLPDTEVSIIEIDKSETPTQIANFLKQAYFGNAQELEGKRLEGLIAVGEIPLPVVNKNGNRFISMYPYTDFENPGYIYDPSTNFFEYKTQVDSPEIWHGVIRIEGATPEDYVTYFNKNHDFYQGNEPDAAIFYADTIQDQSGINSSLITPYENFLTYMDEIAYNRYSKTLLAAIKTDFDAEIENLIGRNLDISRDDTPDILTKELISKYFTRATNLFSGSLNKQSPALLGTGRYDSSDYLTPITAIARKDEYLMQYFLMLNTMLESEIDNIVEEAQQNITINKGAAVKGEALVFNPPTLSSSSGTLTVANTPIFASYESDPVYFINNAPTEQLRREINTWIEASPGLTQTSSDYIQANGGPALLAQNMDQLVNGTPLDQITDASQCRLYRGGGLGGNFAQTVEILRGTEEKCDALWQGRNSRATWQDIQDQFECSLFYGANLRDEYRPELTELQFKSQLTHEACFNFRTEDSFEKLVDSTSLTQQSPDRRYELANSPQSLGSTTLQFELNPENSLIIPLAQAFAKVMNLSEPNLDWNAWGSYILGNPIKDEFEVQNPYNSQDFSVIINGNPVSISEIESRGIRTWPQFVSQYAGTNLTELRLSRTLSTQDRARQVTLKVSKFGSEGSIPSVVYHKDPSNDIIQKAFESLMGEALPIDEIRYVTFVDKQGEKREIAYPDAFKAKSIEDLRAQVARVGEELSEITGNNEVNNLLQLINAQSDSLAQNNTVLNRASSNVIKDLFDWKSFDLNQKYTYSIESFLNESLDHNLVQNPNSFEIAVLNSKSNEDGLTYQLTSENSFGLKIPDESINPETPQFESEFEAESTQRQKERQAIDLLGDVTVPFTEWFDYIQNEWIPESTQLIADIISPQSANLKTYNETIGSSQKEVTDIKIDVGSKNQSIVGSPEVSVTITVLDEDGNKVIGSTDYIEVNVQGPGQIADLSDADPAKPGAQLFMVTGQSKIKIKPTNRGKTTITAKLGSLTQSESITFHETLKLDIKANKTKLTAGSTDSINISIQTLNEDNEPIETSRPQMTISNQIASLELLTTENQSTEFNYVLTPNDEAGNLNIKASSPSSTEDSIDIEITPNAPDKLRFKLLETNLNSSSESELSLEISAIDELNNVVKSNIDNVLIQADVPNKIEILTPNVNIRNGKATIRVKAKDKKAFGNAYIKAEKPGLNPAYHKVNLGSEITDTTLNSMDNSFLYLEMKTGLNNLIRANPLIKNGRTLAVSTLTTDIDGYAPYFYIHPTGAVETISENLVKSDIKIKSGKIINEITDKQNQKIATITVDPSSLELVNEVNNETSIRGIFVKSYTENLQEILSIDQSGLPVILNPEYKIRSKSNAAFFALEIYNENQVVADVMYNFEAPESVQISLDDHPEIQYKKGYTLPSTTSEKGYIFFNPNQKISNEMLPQSRDLRDEKSLQTELVGLREGDKSTLLFAAGQSAGEANKPYLSEAGILLGDPVIKLGKPENISLESEFGYDIGELIGQSESEIVQILERDNDILIADRSGNISKFSKSKQKLYKNLIKIPGGIKEISKINNQIIVLTQNPCTQKDSCVYLLDDQGKLTNLNLNSDSKIVKLLPSDFNGDGREDLGVMTKNENLVIYFAQGNNFSTSPFVAGNTSISLNQSQNKIDEVWIQDPNGTNPIRVKTTESQTTTTQTNSGRVTVTDQTAPIYRTINFSSVSNLEQLEGSTLRRVDKGGGKLRNGDTIIYQLNLTSTTSINNALISIPLSPNLKLNPETLSPQNLQIIETELADRTQIITGVTVPANGLTQISFEVTYEAPDNTDDAIITIVTDEGSYTADSLPDFQVNIPGSNETSYIYSNYQNGNPRYQSTQQNLGNAEVPDPNLPANLRGIDPANPSSSTVTAARNLENEAFASDDDRDGVPNAFDSINNGLNAVASSVEDTIKNLTCSGGGCIATPYNYAFLVPDGIELPVFGWGCGIIPIWPPTPWRACSGGRIYVSPTLTGEIAGAVCLGPQASGQCIAFRIADLGSLCDTINAGIQDIMRSATSFARGQSGNAVASAGGQDGFNFEANSNIQVPGFPATITNWITAQVDEIKLKLFDLPDLTIIYPDPYSLLAGGFDIQEEELDFDSLPALLAKIHAMPLFNIELVDHDIKYPFITPEEIAKYETQIEQIKRQNIAVLQRAANSWGCYGSEFVNQSQFEADLADGILGFQNTAVLSARNECIQLEIGIFQMLASFDANLDALKAYRDLPKNLFEIENFLANYANQLIGYIDEILSRTAGYLTENTERLLAWQNLFIDIQNLVDDFSVIMDISIDYMEACDDCRSNRTNGGLTFLFNLFGPTPDIPVIAIPKWPDLTLDISQIEAGVDIKLPSFNFKPDPIQLPDLKPFVISLPDAPPIGFVINTPEFGFTIMPTIPSPPDLESFIIDLPDLPELEIPKLPSIPKPPSIESFGLEYLGDIEAFLETFSTVLRIYCLIQKGFIPVPESTLRTQIETLTARPLTPVLPVDIGFGFQFPGFETEYIDEVRFILQTRLNFDFTLIDEAVSGLVEIINEAETNLNDEFELLLQDAANEIPIPEEIELPGTDEINELDLEVEPGAESDLESAIQKLLSYEPAPDYPDEIRLEVTTQKLKDLPKSSIATNQNYDFNPLLKHQRDLLVAYQTKNKDEINKLQSQTIIAQTNAQNKANETPITTQKFQIAQAATPQTTNLNYQAQGGIYFINQSGLTEEVVRYQGETDQNTIVKLIDVNSDGFEDIIYSRGKELFIKYNLKTEQKRGRTSRINSYNFNDLKTKNTLPLEIPQVASNATHNNVTLQIPKILENETVVIDVYKGSTTRNLPYKRFTLNDNDSKIKKEKFSEIENLAFAETLRLQLENNAYLISLSTLDDNDNIQIVAPHINTTPNFCSDRSGPNIEVSPSNIIEVLIQNPVNISLENSSDSESEIAEFYMDTNPTVDSDGDGNPRNDRDLQGNRDNRSNPNFRLAAQNQTGSRQVIANAVDIAGNHSSETITINVVNPRIQIESATNRLITGSINPKDDNIELELIRDRSNQLTSIGETKTNEDGKFIYNNLTVNDFIAIYNAENDKLFRINKLTGSITKENRAAKIEVIQAIPKINPTQIILKENAKEVTRLTRISNPNLDVQIKDRKPEGLKGQSGVIVVDEDKNDEFVLSQIPGDSEGYAGGAELKSQAQSQVIIDTDGSIILTNQNLTLELEEISNPNEDQWFQIYDRSDLILSVYVGIGKDQIQITNPTYIPEEQSAPESESESPTNNSSPSGQNNNRQNQSSRINTQTQRFVDVDQSDPDSEIINYLQQTGVIDGVQRDNATYFEPDREIQRAEYAKIILNTLCILPSEEAKRAPIVFNDILFIQDNPAWFYAWTKETFLRGFFTGYLGEIDPATGLAPFKPANPITRAEATKVILEALNALNTIDISGTEPGVPWYLPYMQISQNLTPYLENDNVNEPFVLTPDEATVPLKQITRREFVIMAYRVLNINNCLTLDQDQDGLPYYYEIKNNLNPNQNDASEDADSDGSSNLNEYQNGTDPQAPNNNPEPTEPINDNNQPDNNPPQVITPNGEGGYLNSIPCLTCPCEYRIEHESTLIKGDKLFAIIKNNEGEIIQVSNKFEIQ